VPSTIESVFSERDRDAIREATRAAEADTSAELVVYVTERSDEYAEATWRLVGLGAALGASFGAIAVAWFGGWGTPDDLWMLIGVELGVFLGLVASLVEPVRRRVIADRTIAKRTEARAAEAFVEEQVFATERRSGILLFVSLFEHRVIVLADAGIDQKVDAEAWNRITDGLAAGIRAGAPTKALVEAVGKCAELLAKHGVGPRPGDTDELENEPRFRVD
jgi:putative membrane protein